MALGRYSQEQSAGGKINTDSETEFEFEFE